MPTPTAAEIVAECDTAIWTLMRGGAVQRYIVAGKDISAYNLKQLQEVRAYYAEIAVSEANGGGGQVSLAVFGTNR